MEAQNHMDTFHEKTEKPPSRRGQHLKEAWAKDPEGMKAKLAAARAAKKAKKEQENG